MLSWKLDKLLLNSLIFILKNHRDLKKIKNVAVVKNYIFMFFTHNTKEKSSRMESFAERKFQHHKANHSKACLKSKCLVEV